MTLPDGTHVSFPIDQFSKICLLEGIDQLGYLLGHQAQIVAYERERRIPWRVGFLL
jgi:3-isopropylmalate/(R)-2-methylmalate dehydratase small subunit